MNPYRDRDLVDAHLLDALVVCEPCATDEELADFILQHFAHVPLEDTEARNVALQMLTEGVQSKRAEVKERFRVRQ